MQHAARCHFMAIWRNVVKDYAKIFTSNHVSLVGVLAWDV